jgi:hypothetical protein
MAEFEYVWKTIMMNDWLKKYLCPDHYPNLSCMACAGGIFPYNADKTRIFSSSQMTWNRQGYWLFLDDMGMGGGKNGGSRRAIALR